MNVPVVVPKYVLILLLCVNYVVWFGLSGSIPSVHPVQFYGFDPVFKCCCCHANWTLSLFLPNPTLIPTHSPPFPDPCLSQFLCQLYTSMVPAKLSDPTARQPKRFPLGRLDNKSTSTKLANLLRNISWWCFFIGYKRCFLSWNISVADSWKKISLFSFLVGFLFPWFFVGVL